MSCVAFAPGLSNHLLLTLETYKKDGRGTSLKGERKKEDYKRQREKTEER